MTVIATIHFIGALLFLFCSILLSFIYLTSIKKKSSLINILVNVEWFTSALMFFIGIILIMMYPFWFQIGLFHIKMTFSMFSIGIAQYFYKLYYISIENDYYPNYLYYFRILIPSILLIAYYLGIKLKIA